MTPEEYAEWRAKQRPALVEWPREAIEAMMEFYRGEWAVGSEEVAWWRCTQLLEAALPFLTLGPERPTGAATPSGCPGKDFTVTAGYGHARVYPMVPCSPTAMAEWVAAKLNAVDHPPTGDQPSTTKDGVTPSAHQHDLHRPRDQEAMLRVPAEPEGRGSVNNAQPTGDLREQAAQVADIYAKSARFRMEEAKVAHAEVSYDIAEAEHATAALIAADIRALSVPASQEPEADGMPRSGWWKQPGSAVGLPVPTGDEALREKVRQFLDYIDDGRHVKFAAYCDLPLLREYLDALRRTALARVPQEQER